MAIRGSEPSDNGDGPRWLKKWIEAQEKRSREHEERMREHEERMGENEERRREHEERMRAIEGSQEELKQISLDLRDMIRASNARLSRLEDSVAIQKEEVALSRRQTRQLVAEVSRMDAERRRDRVQYARLFKGMLTTIRRIGR